MFRNCAVYHQLNTLGGATWIFVSLPSQLKNELGHLLSEENTSNSNSIWWHLALLGEAFRGWRQYVNFLDEKFQEIVRVCL